MNKDKYKYKDKEERGSGVVKKNWDENGGSKSKEEYEKKNERITYT